MQNSFSLNELYVHYAAGLLDKKKFEGAIFKSIRDNLYQYGLPGWDRGDYDDYLSSLYLRISRAIDAYQETGSSFEIYMGSIVRLTAREYRAHQTRCYHKETAAWITQIPDMYACEDEAEYNERIAPDTEGVQFNNPRQLLILILKCSSHISMDFLERISPRLGMEPKVILRMIDHLLGQQEKRMDEKNLQSEQINYQFYSNILLEKRIIAAEDSVAAQRLKKMLERRQDKLLKKRMRFARTRLDPSNSQIAQLLGISKGTVDSVLYNLKNRNPSLNSCQKNIE
ncbi:MAG: hypothetical protein FWC24_04460 [Treponema sp.]|nr:hypothetical protein [Treponema sp.]